jgi:type IV pilus assembly protein PilM
MPSTKTVWGIDVGQCALKAIKLQWRDDKLRALAFDVIEHAKILSQPDADEQALIRSALGKFLSRNSIKGATVVISVPGQASFTRFIKLPPVESRKIPEIVRYEARQQIPFNLEDVVWDYQTISPPSAGPREVEVGIFAMKRDIVNDYVSDFLAMRIEPDIVQMAPVSLYNFLRYDKKDGGGATLLIDVGAENTNLVISDGDRVWIRNVPLGGNNFTQALAKEFKLPFSKAENLKRHAAESRHARQVFQAMRPVFGDLLTEIQRSIGYYTSLHRDSRVERVVALGNAFRLAGLAKFVSQNLGVDVQKVEGITSLADSEILGAPLFRENILSFGVAFGLAVQGLGLGAIGTSLLPPEILSQKVLRQKRPYFIAAGAAVFLAVACFAYDQGKTYGELSGHSGQVKQLASKVKEIADENAAQKTRFDEQVKAMAAEQDKIQEVQSLTGDESYVYEIYRTLWSAWPGYKDAEPAAASVPWSSLSVIEMLSLSVRYVPDVQAYSESVAATGADTPAGGAKAGAMPGVLVQFTGLTPVTGHDAQALIESSLIEPLKKHPWTWRLGTGPHEDVLAKRKSEGMFSTVKAFQEYSRRGAARPGETGLSADLIAERGRGWWFEAQWVVHVPEETRSEAAAAPKPNLPAGQAGSGAAATPAAQAAKSAP